MLATLRRLVQGYPPIVTAIDREKLSYLGKRALADLYGVVQETEGAGRPGVLVEAGCALGGSAIVMAWAKKQSRPLHVFDVFGMIPPPTEADGEDVRERYSEILEGKSKGIGNDVYYGYETDLRAKVEENFRRFGVPIAEANVRLVQGLFEETMHLSEPVAIAHIDGDWYSSVKTSLERILPWLVRGGVLVIDDYEAWSGCRKAVDEVFEYRRNDFAFVQKSRLHIVRTSDWSQPQ